jgi:hypothetical protein
VFLVGCATILGFSALARGWRAAAQQEALSERGASAPVSPLRTGFDDDHVDLTVVVPPPADRLREAPRA